MNRFHAYVMLLLLLMAAPICGAQDLVLTGAKVYASPTAAPTENATVIVHDGKIEAVSAGKVPVGKGTETLDCRGKVIVAGFWNSHVHFENGWQNAADTPAEKLEAHMQEMLTRWGVTTVWDLGSLPSNTLAIRRRVESGEVPGPRILMAGDIFPKNGHPVYLPAEMQLPEAATAQEAQQMTQGYMKAGFDGLKLFTGAYMGYDKPVINCPPTS